MSAGRLGQTVFLYFGHRTERSGPGGQTVFLVFGHGTERSGLGMLLDRFLSRTVESGPNTTNF